jgi:signal transduction histidine kinase
MTSIPVPPAAAAGWFLAAMALLSALWFEFVATRWQAPACFERWRWAWAALAAACGLELLAQSLAGGSAPANTVASGLALGSGLEAARQLRAGALAARGQDRPGRVRSFSLVNLGLGGFAAATLGRAAPLLAGAAMAWAAVELVRSAASARPAGPGGARARVGLVSTSLGALLVAAVVAAHVLRKDAGAIPAVCGGAALSLMSLGSLSLLLEHELLRGEAQRTSAAVLQQRLSRAQRLETVGTLASGVAHELAGPLTSVLGYTEILRQRARTSEDRRALAVIEEQAERCAEIVRRLTGFAREGATGRAALDVGELARRVARGFEPQLAARRAVLELELEPDLPRLQGDATGLEQVLANLIANALESGGAGTTIRVRARHCPGAAGSSPAAVELAVLDDGPGLEPQVQERLFEPFFSARARDRGTGLGLYLSRSIVAAHGGTISGRNRTAPERGAVFSVRLPAAGARGPQVEPSAPLLSRPAPAARRAKPQLATP